MKGKVVAILLLTMALTACGTPEAEKEVLTARTVENVTGASIMPIAIAAQALPINWKEVIINDKSGSVEVETIQKLIDEDKAEEEIQQYFIEEFELTLPTWYALHYI